MDSHGRLLVSQTLQETQSYQVEDIVVDGLEAVYNVCYGLGGAEAGRLVFCYQEGENGGEDLRR
jgi:hypothetical protein